MRQRHKFVPIHHLLRFAGDTSAERISVSTSSPLEAGNVPGMRKALAELEVLDVFKVLNGGLGYSIVLRVLLPG